MQKLPRLLDSEQLGLEDSDGDSEVAAWGVEDLPHLWTPPLEAGSSYAASMSSLERGHQYAETKMSFAEFERQQLVQRELRQQARAHELAIRKANRPGTPPQESVPGVPGQLVPRPPISQENAFSLLRLD